MSYRVGIDFGTTFTAAAVHRDTQTVELVPLGDNGTAMPSVIFLAPDGSLVVGDAAVRRAVTDPDRVVREAKRRIGDQTPILVAGEPVEAHTLAARVILSVLERVVDREGADPEGIAVSHPASWGPHKRTLLASALADAGLADITLVTEPAAAAVAYTASQHVEPGSAIGVYDLGGGTFDAAIVRQLDSGGFELVGRPEGIESLGGIDFDEAIFERVRATLGKSWAQLDFTDPMVLTAAATLRRECTEAKQALSSDTEVTIPVLLPGISTSVRMVRAELEDLIGPAIDETVDAMRRAMDSGGLVPADLAAVLLVGGSSRIPLVAQRVSAELNLPVTVDSDPKAVVAMGAALAIASDPGGSVLILPTESLAEPPRRSRRRVVATAVVLAAAAAALVTTAGAVGHDILPIGASSPEKEVAAQEAVPPPAPGPGQTDPWTGEQFTPTTPPGPQRPKAKPATASPTALSPTPATGNDRAALIAGAPTTFPPSSGGEVVNSTTTNGSPDVLSSGGDTSTAPGTSTPDPTSTTDPTTVAQDPTTTQEPPPPDPTTPDPTTPDPTTPDPTTQDPPPNTSTEDPPTTTTEGTP